MLLRKSFYIGAALAALTGCGEEAGPTNNSSGLPQDQVSSYAGQEQTGTAGTIAGGTAGSVGLPNTSTGTTYAPGTGSTASAPDSTGTIAVAAGTDSLPCDIESIIQTYCQECHAATPKFGAPMPLVTMADFEAQAVSDPTKTVLELVSDRINRQEAAGKMPPVSSEALPAAELAAFNAWLSAPATGTEACAADPAPTEGTTEGSSTTALEGDDDLECYEFRAHAPGSSTEPYAVGIARDAYFNFSFNAPWEGTRYAKVFRSLIDNDQVLHHWLMYKDPVLHANDGAISGSSGAHPGGELVHGWAPGGDDLVIEEDAGIAMPKTGFTLELHYNSSDPTALDRSGIEICVTSKKPANVAAISWLGTDAINGPSASGTCSPASGQRIRIMGGTPHMHTYGKHMKVEIMRANGGSEVILDEPFDFDYQRSYSFDEEEIWLEPGDRVKTTCDWTRPVTFGEGTGDEMCYFFTLHYPAQALASPGLDDLIHGPNTCGVL